ncbi:MAG: N-acetyltransferase family protein [Wenzhouxiangella sp.]
MSKQSSLTRYRLGRPWCEAIELPDRRRFILRPMTPADAPKLREGFRNLTPEEIRMRFMHPISELTPRYALQLATLDPEHEFALVLVEAKPPEEAAIHAVTRARIDESGEAAEFAIIVGGDLKRHGLGRLMLGRTVEWCRKKGLAAIYGFILRDNRPMLALTRSLGFRLLETETADVIEARLEFPQSPARH